MAQDWMIAELDQTRIQHLIPHRPPFLLIDRVRDIVPDESATGITHLSGDEYFFRGHFPGYPVMPAMLIVEAMAQTAAVLGGCTLSTDCRTLSYFAGLDRARFRAPVTPGDTLELHVKKHRRHAAVWQFTAEARVDHKVVAEALFTAVNMGRAAALSTVLGQFGQAKTTSRDGAAPPL